MKETEITVEVFETKNDIEKFFNKSGYKIIDHYFMNDWYFTGIEKTIFSSLNYKDKIKNSFLVRQIINSDKSSKNLIVYKNKIINEKEVVISEEKTDTKFENLENCLKVFDLAGLNNWCEIKQDIFSFEKANIKFAIQYVDGLGVFLEYEEDESMAGLSAEEKIEYMKGIVKNLGLQIGNNFSCKKVLMKISNSKN